MKTRKRLRAHQSIHLAIIYMPPVAFTLDLLGGDGLSVFLARDRHLPCAAGAERPGPS